MAGSFAYADRAMSIGAREREAKIDLCDLWFLVNNNFPRNYHIASIPFPIRSTPKATPVSIEKSF
jgi:hypothetical protein